jgi:hypothetical protein
MVSGHKVCVGSEDANQTIDQTQPTISCVPGVKAGESRFIHFDLRRDTHASGAAF